jgi:hypothetical protein
MTEQTRAFLDAAHTDTDPAELARLLHEAERAETDAVVAGKFEEVYQTLQALQREQRDVWLMQNQLRRVVSDLSAVAGYEP